MFDSKAVNKDHCYLQPCLTLSLHVCWIHVEHHVNIFQVRTSYVLHVSTKRHQRSLFNSYILHRCQHLVFRRAIYVFYSLHAGLLGKCVF
jgi:hypothetical protein